jgi:hypothetical protein
MNNARNTSFRFTSSVIQFRVWSISVSTKQRKILEGFRHFEKIKSISINNSRNTSLRFSSLVIHSWMWSIPSSTRKSRILEELRYSEERKCTSWGRELDQVLRIDDVAERDLTARGNTWPMSVRIAYWPGFQEIPNDRIQRKHSWDWPLSPNPATHSIKPAVASKPNWATGSAMGRGWEGRWAGNLDY